MVTREELYALVWSKPMTKVGEQFGVSGSYMARVCATLRVPRPERGYWAKLAVGEAPPPRPLPEAEPGDELFWSQDDGFVRSTRAPRPAAPPKTPGHRPTRRVTGPHALIRHAKTHFENSRPGKDGEYLRPYKKLLVDVTASAAGLDKALSFANSLFNALESAGFRVVIAPQSESLHGCEIDEHEQPPTRHTFRSHALWRPQRPTVVYIGTVAIGLA